MLYIRKKREKTMEQRKEAIICLEGLGKAIPDNERNSDRVR